MRLASMCELGRWIWERSVLPTIDRNDRAIVQGPRSVHNSWPIGAHRQFDLHLEGPNSGTHATVVPAARGQVSQIELGSDDPLAHMMSSGCQDCPARDNQWRCRWADRRRWNRWRH